MQSPIDEHHFDELADRALRSLETALGDVEGLEADLESGILTLEFDDGQRFVINSHRAARQIWVAAAGRAWHFDVEPTTQRWTATKSGDELWACLEAEIGKKLGRAFGLTKR